ncbi:hypothetical protein PPACK8108_LOCUS13034 [Phakopsora pachyrhizi]|uniref:ABC transporter domain-containing protein n=1 Tax=Phakopsora pachyrhizi TaxID=170000 RepID=A0AAV0B4Y4_PHAPC|nr:hypothetical protein PPACK8108_LOCUS13034 [Phakopsora pachyrhizi]
MEPSVSKQQGLAEKAEKNLAKVESSGPCSTTPSSGLVTPMASQKTVVSTNALSNLTPKFKAASVQICDIQIFSCTLKFHDRLLIENAEISPNYGQRAYWDKNFYKFSRYGLLGDKRSGKTTFLHSLA